MPNILWLSFYNCRSPLVKSLQPYLNSCPIRGIITQGGLIYKDDKFIFRLKGNERYQSTVAQAYRMFGRAIKRRRPRLFLQYLDRLLFKNYSLTERLKSLFKVDEDVVLTRLDSDDCLHKDWFKNMPKLTEGESAICKAGYLHNVITGELANWLPKTCPQTFAVFIPRDTFNDPKKFHDHWQGYQSHEDADRVFKPIIHPNKFLMTIHGNQISSTWDHPFRGEIIIEDTDGGSKDKTILKDFGL